MAYIPQSKSLAQNLFSDAATAATPFLDILGKSMGYENLGYDKKQARGAAILGEKALENRLRYGKSQEANEEVAKMEYETIHGPGSYKAMKNATGFNVSQEPLQPTNEIPEQRKNSAFLDKLNELAGVYQNRLLGQVPQSFEQPQMQQPYTQQLGLQQGIPSRMDLLSGQFPHEMMQAPGQFIDQRLSPFISERAKQQRQQEEQLFAQEQAQKQMQRQQAELAQQEEQRYQQELDAKEKFEPKPEDYKQLAQEVDSLENLPEGIKKRKIAQYTKEAANLQKKQDKINSEGAVYDKALDVQEKAAKELKKASATLRNYVIEHPEYFGRGISARAIRANPLSKYKGDIDQAINSLALEKLPSLPGAAKGGKALLEALFKSKPGFEMTPEAILKYLENADKTADKMLREVDLFSEIKIANGGNLPSYWKEFAQGKYIPIETLKQLGSPKNFPPDYEVYDDETDTTYRVINKDWRIV